MVPLISTKLSENININDVVWITKQKLMSLSKGQLYFKLMSHEIDNILEGTRIFFLIQTVTFH